MTPDKKQSPVAGRSFGQWLKQRRKSLDMTQEQLAESVGCSLITIMKIEAGERRPSRQIAEIMAESLGIPAGERLAFIQFARSEAPGSTATSKVEGPGIVDPGSRIGDQGAEERTAPERGSRLPLPLTSLIGRERETEQIAAYLLSDKTRMVTLTGPPGIGKTRLALHLAAQSADSFPDGVYFVNLAPVADPDLVPATITKALNFHEAANQPSLEKLKSHLQDRQTLLVLDNFEQVMAASEQIVDLLTYCRQLKLLVTSREALRVRGERRYVVPTLELPDSTGLLDPDELGKNPAVALYVDRAQEVDPDFKLNTDNSSAVAAICKRLDGLPLGIELVAARANLFSPQTLLERLDSRLALLTTGPRDLPTRHRTLRNAIGWSYDLLSESERKLFRRLGVFTGSCTLAAAEAVCNANGDLSVQVLELVASLLDKNLVHQERVPASASGNEGVRFAMLETIREYALDRLAESGEESEVRLRHAEYYLALAELVEFELRGHGRSKWFERLNAEDDNLRAALRLALNSRITNIALRLASPLCVVWTMRGDWSEGREQMAQVLALAAEEQAPQNLAYARALYGAGRLAEWQSDYAVARSLFEKSHDIYDKLTDKAGIADTLNSLGNIEHDFGENDKSEVLFKQSLELRRELDDKPAIANSLYGLGRLALERGDYDLARSLREESLHLFRQMGHRGGEAAMLASLGEVARCQDNFEEARKLNVEALSIFREVGNKRGIASALTNLAHIAHHIGQNREAASLFGESLAEWQRLRNLEGLASCLSGIAGIAIANNQAERAVTLLGAVDAMLRGAGARLATADELEYKRNLANAQQELDSINFAASLRAGQAMVVEQAVALAITI